MSDAETPKNIQKLVVLGASNAFWEIHELVEDINSAGARLAIVAVLDDDSDSWNRTLVNVSASGPLERAKSFGSDIKFVFGIGSYRTRLLRASILERLGIPDERFETLVHPAAKIFSSASVGPGCIVHFGTAVFSGAKLEPFAIVSANTVIATNNLVGRGALVGSGVITADRAAIGAYAHIGQGSLIAERCEIGAAAQIGMGSVVMQNVKAGAFGVGNPLRFIGRVEVPDDVVRQWEMSKQAFIREESGRQS